MARDYRLSIRLSDEEAEALLRVCREISTSPRHLLMAGVLQYQNVGQITPNGVEVAPKGVSFAPKGVNRPTLPYPPFPSAPTPPPPSAPTPPPTTTPITPPTKTPQTAPAHVRVRGETGDAEFDAFWKAYPKRCPRRDKAEALKSWRRLSPPLDAVIAAIAWQDQTPEWVKDDGEFIPAPAVWLNQRRWEREKPVTEEIAPVEGHKEPILSLKHFLMLRMRGHLAHYDADSVAKFETQARASPMEVLELEAQLGGGVPQKETG